MINDAGLANVGDAQGAVPTSREGVPPTGRARLLPYALWQFRDYALNKGIATVLVMAILLLPAYLASRVAGFHANAAAVDLVVRQSLTQIMTYMVYIGVVLATNGIVAEDRKLGYYRFYFAKPVRAPAFYAQKFAVHLVGFLLVALLLLGALGYLLRPTYPPAYLPVLALLFIGIGGIGFMLSAITTADWLSVVGVLLVSLMGWTLFGEDDGWRGLLVHLLPPVHRLSDIYLAVVTHDPVPMKWLAWITGYGVACGIIGLVVLSRRRLATT